MSQDRAAEPEQYDISMSIVAYRQRADEVEAVLRDLRSTRRVHVTVVDNSPTPELRNTVQARGARYVPMEHNLGFGGGHNVALRSMLGRARFHAVVNPDITAAKDVLAALYRFMETHPSVGQVMPDIRNPDGTEQRLAKRLPTPADLLLRRFGGGLAQRIARQRWDKYEMRDMDLSVPREVPCLSGCFMFLRDSVLQQVGLFDERFFLYMEDFDLCRRIGAVSQTVMLPTVQVTHGYTKGSYKRAGLLRLHLQSAVRYFNKWGWFFDRERGARNQRVAELEDYAETAATAEEAVPSLR